eukprot:139840-Lingulodinium_polyedra.AAC.1
MREATADGIKDMIAVARRSSGAPSTRATRSTRRQGPSAWAARARRNASGCASLSSPSGTRWPPR